MPKLEIRPMSPADHWNDVLRRTGLCQLSYDAAREYFRLHPRLLAQDVLMAGRPTTREPGEDDE